MFPRVEVAAWQRRFASWSGHERASPVAMIRGLRSARLLRPGETCWRIERARRLDVLVDGAAYGQVLRRALQAAQNAIYILGWDVDTRTPIAGADDMERGDDEADDGMAIRLLPFLNQLLDQRPRLHIHVLCWDFALLFTFERELLPRIQFAWRGHRRLHFELDDTHPPGGSHHQKLVVIDDEVAFLGGMDLAIRRWDTPAHAPDDPRRLDPDGRPYPPHHDVQVAVEGPIAGALGELFRARWSNATGDQLAAPTVDARPLLRDESTRDVDLAIARTEFFDGHPPQQTREIERLTVEAIASAQRSIYVENQYLTSSAVGTALASRLAASDGPEVLLVVPKSQHGWLEHESMGMMRARLLEKLQAADRHHRLRVLWPAIGEVDPVPIQVHSKVMVVDDRFLKIGSSNWANRSLTIDSECDLALEAAGNERLGAVIGDLRARLLAEHLGCTADEVIRAQAQHGLHGAIDRLASLQRRLVPLEPGRWDWDLAVFDGLVCDPETPVRAEDVLTEVVSRPPHVRRALPLWLAVITGLVLVTVALRFTPAGEILHPSRLAGLAWLAHPSWLALAGLVVAVALLSIFFVPITALMALCVVLLKPLTAFFVLYAGALLGASTSFFIGRWAGLPPLGQWLWRKAHALRGHLRRGGFLAVIAARLFPVGNFGLINILAGAMAVPFRSFLAGNLVGLLPGLVLITFLSDRLARIWSHPNPRDVALILIALAAFIFVVMFLRKQIRRRGIQRDDHPATE